MAAVGKQLQESMEDCLKLTAAVATPPVPHDGAKKKVSFGVRGHG